MNSTVSPTVEKLLIALEEHNVVYCHWKSIDHLSAALTGSTDLDILVSIDHAKVAENIAESCGFVEMKTAELRRYPGVLDFIAYDSEQSCFHHLHLHYQLVLGDRWVKAYRLPVEADVLSRRIWLDESSTWVVSPWDELVIFCARMCVKFTNPFAAAKNIEEADFIIARTKNESLPLPVENIYHPHLLNTAKILLEKGCSGINPSLVKSTRAVMSQYRRMSSSDFFFLSKIRLLYRLYVEFYRRKLHNFSFGRRRISRGGMVVAFVGMDGSGKTSAISRNLKFFAQQMDVKAVFLGSGKSGAPWYRRFVFSILGTNARFTGHKKVSSCTGQAKRYPLYYLLWLILVIRDRTKRIRSIFRYRSNCCLVFVDRWPQGDIPGSFDGPKLKNVKSNSFFVGLVKGAESNCIALAKHFHPDMVFRFRVSSATALSRKPGELTIEQAIKAEEDLLRIKWPNHCSVVDLNADDPIEDVDRQIRKTVWLKICGKSP